MSNKKLTVAVIVVAIIAIIGLFSPAGQRVISGVITGITNYDRLGLLSLKVASTCNSGTTFSGCTGTELARINTGFCNVHAGAATAPGSTNVLVQCDAGTNSQSALTGVTAGDVVFVSPATTSKQAIGSGIFVTGASASSTSGFIDVNLYNASTTAFTYVAAATTSWQYFVIDLY